MKLEKWEYKYIKEFENKLKKKIEKARKQYGLKYLKLTKKRMKKEIEEELLDIAGWSLMYWMKLRKEKKL